MRPQRRISKQQLRLEAEQAIRAWPGAAVMTDRVDYLLAELRCAAMRARLAALDIEAIALATQNGLISPEQAINLLYDCDALVYIEPTAPWRDPDGKIHADAKVSA
jgi:hypothetical protein